MSNAPAARHPIVRLRWLLETSPDEPAWMNDDRWIPPGERQLYSSGKYGLYAVFKQLGDTGTVLLPAYVPGGVTWAALAAGFDVRYYPVSEDLSLPVADVIDRIRSVDPAVVLFVHYFGFADDGFGELVEASRRQDAVVVEDCARGLFARDPKYGLLGSTGDVALFSLHKTLPAPNGGLIVSSLGTPPEPRSNAAEFASIPQAAAITFAHWLRIRTDRSTQVTRPRDRQPNAVSPTTPRTGIGPVSRRALTHCDPATIRSARQGRYRALRDLLCKNDDLTVLSPPATDGSVPFGVAALSASAVSRARQLRNLHRNGLPCDVLTWPPVYRHDEVTAFDGAETLRSRLIVLPTHQQLDPVDIGRIAAELREAT